MARDSERHFGELWGPVVWSPNKTVQNRSSVSYTLAVRNAKKEMSVDVMFVIDNFRYAFYNLTFLQFDIHAGGAYRFNDQRAD